MISFASSLTSIQDAVLIFLDQDQLKKKDLPVRDREIKEEILSLNSVGTFLAEDGEIFPLATGKRTVVLAGIGPRKDVTPTSLRISVRKAITAPYLNRVKNVAVIPHATEDKTVIAVIEGILIGAYAWKKYVTPDASKKIIEFSDKKITILVPLKKEYQDCVKVCEGVTLTRNLINDNADTVTSTFLEKTVKDLTSRNKNISLEVLNRKELEAKGLHLHLAVNRGSNKEPKLIIVKYSGAGPKEGYTALVGKGMTFDTGGLNLKPTGSMETMKIDMSGAASVIGILKNVISLGLKKNVICAVGLAENAIDANSYKPGDVITGYAGKSVEIGNTDAEGRLVLADALAYVIKNYRPKRVIDIATLTGACVIALGYDYTGLMSNNDHLAEGLLMCSRETDDRAWRMPLYPELTQHIRSQIADLKNTGLPKGAAGTCSAGEFLRQFVGETPWAHLDIAGTAYTDQGRLYFGHGATGSSVRLLTHYLANQA